MNGLTKAGLSYFAREHVFRQLGELGALDGMDDGQRKSLECDSIGEISKLAVKKGYLPVVVLLPHDAAMSAYENAEAIQTTLS